MESFTVPFAFFVVVPPLGAGPVHGEPITKVGRRTHFSTWGSVG